MFTDVRALLTEVAEGRLDPAEAARLLDQAPAAAPAQAESQPAPDDAAAAVPPPSPDQAVRRVVVRATARSVRLVGDVTVDSATVEGPHAVYREGADLVVGPPEAAAEPGSYSYEQRSTLSRWLAESSTWGTPLTVRVHPTLPVEAEVTAGALRISGLAAPLSVKVTAGSLVVADCVAPVQGVVRAGSARLDMRPVGESSVRVETGSVDLRLQPGSDVRVRTRVQLGEVSVRGADGTWRKVSPEGTEEVVVGTGRDTVDLDLVMGSAKVRLP
ncbi:MAG: hypothetical protein MUC45_02165 [Actinomycetia bacterium]|nr:hypothetical protein [Actinomycetes bacterium]